MNKTILLGRLTKEPEIKTSGETTMLNFTIAVNRPYKNKDGEYDADFINCIAFNQKADVIAKYVSKGERLLITDGEWQTGSYENQDGQMVYTNKCKVNQVEFIEQKSDGYKQDKPSGETKPQDFEKKKELNEDDLPF